jgi:quercetin dioxygenase-like cupin family protein
MKRLTFQIPVLTLCLVCTLQGTEIHQQSFNMTPPGIGEITKEVILPDEIPEIEAEHIAITGPASYSRAADANHALVLLFVAGKGTLDFHGNQYEIVPETIAMPISLEEVKVDVLEGETIHFLQIRKAYNEQDRLDMPLLESRKSGGIYFKKFTDCQPYKEAIKSPKTTSRTVLPNQIVPRMAMGTVETTGPDEVGAHRHPMLDQMFLGLAENDVVVTADETHARLKEFSLLHIPLGSLHGVKAEPGTKLYYMWMDFFLTKEGEEWLKTHKPVTE